MLSSIMKREILEASKALAFIHNEIVVTRRPDEIMNADGVVLPGVGAFKDCIENLRSTGLSDVVKKVIQRVPFLGICWDTKCCLITVKNMLKTENGQRSCIFVGR